MILKTQWIRGLAFALALLALPLALVVSIAVFPNWAAHSRLQVTPFSWYNVDGELTSFRGSQAPFTLLFIGFLSCDSVCPVRLANLANIARQRDRDQLQLLFLTLDGDRDTPEVRRRLVDSLGIESGRMTQSALQALRFELGDRTDKLARHSPRVYLLSREGRLVDIFSGEDLSWQVVQDRIASPR